MTEHTKTPWRVEQGTDLIWGACNPYDQSTYGMGYSIARGVTASWGKRRPDMDEREANAAFIVRACNAHDALVAALTELQAMVKGECPSLLNEDSGGCARLDLDIDAALALAKGTP